MVFPIPADKSFCYSVPASMQKEVEEGARVLVPFGNRNAVGFVAGEADGTDIKNVREIAKLLDEKSLISPPLLKLARWMADCYACSFGESLDAILPHRYRPVGLKKKPLKAKR